MSRDERTDAELLRAVADGDGGALRVLYDRHAPWLAVRLRRRCGDGEIVADVLQDTFVAVWRGADRFRGDGEVAAWLWGIGVRRLVSRVRGHPRREVLVADVADVSDRGQAAGDQTMEDAVLLGLEYGDLGEVMASLSPEFRAVIRATVLDGLSTREAGALLGIPTGTVKTRAMRARAQMRAHLTARLEGGAS